MEWKKEKPIEGGMGGCLICSVQHSILPEKDPDNDWRISLIGPMSERHYQRHGKGYWVLYEKSNGFA